MNLFEFVRAGGFVMWPLGALSLACLAVVIERIRAFSRAPAPAALIERARSSTNDAGAFENEVQSVAARHLLELERNLPLLSGVAALSPLLGLLGTVTGMISTFNALSLARQRGSSDAVLGGIGEALYATASGILIAIVALAWYQLFSARVRRVSAEIEALGSSEIANRGNSR